MSKPQLRARVIKRESWQLLVIPVETHLKAEGSPDEKKYSPASM